LISTGKNLQVFDGKTFAMIVDKNKKRTLGVSNICESSKGKICCLKYDKLCSINIENKTITEIDTTRKFTTIHCTKGRVLAANELSDIFELDELDFFVKKKLAINTDSSLLIFKIFEDHKKQIWLLCNKGLYTLQEGKILPFQLNGKKAISAPLLSVSEDNNGQFWFASVQGAFRMRDTVINYFSQSNGLSNNVIYETISDKEGNIWFCSDGEGVFRYSGGPFISLDEYFGLPNKQVTGIAGNEMGEIFFSSYQGKLTSYQLGSTLKPINAPELKNDIITALQYQRNVGLWIGTRSNGLFLRSPKGQIQKIGNSALSPNTNNITSLFVGNNGSLFVGLSRDLLILKDGQKAVVSLKGATPISMENIGVDSLLISTNTGFYLLNGGIASKWKVSPVFDSVVAQCMVKHNDVLYLGTSEKGIIAFNCLDKKYNYFNTKSGLSSDFIYNLLQDGLGNIWAGTGMGICKLSSSETKQPKIKFYGKANGIIGLESNSNASFVDKDGRIWFGTTEGVSCFFPSANPTLAKPVSIVLESVKLFGGRQIDTAYYSRRAGWYDIPEGLNLPYRYNNISFAFQAITLSPVDKIYYRYILEGSSTNWSEWSEENTINFSSIEPGKYVLKVMCKVNEMAQQEVMLTYPFTIRTPFHKSIWFVLSIITLAISTGVILQYAAHRRKQNRMKREEALRREEQSRVRERTAEDFHDEVGNKLTRINVLTDVLKSKLKSPNPDAERIIQQIQDNSQQLYSGTRDILWSLQPSNDNLYEILNHVSDLGNELFSETNISFVFLGNQEHFKEYKMPLDKSRNFIMIWKEALNNCMKYAQAKNILFQAKTIGEGKIQIRLVDDGIGFDKEVVTSGNGLKNMATRAKRLDANLELLSKPMTGTQVILTLPEFKLI
jgi:signal transduction histidine kinase/ligand-binding sensor domain-containing protein